MSDLVTPAIELLTAYDAGKPLEELARERGVTGAIKLASNENPLGPSPRAVEALRAAAGGMHRYPDAAAFRLRERLANRHGVRLEEIIHGNGSNEVIELLFRTFTTPEHHVVFAEPSFVVYRSAALAQNVPFTAVPLRDLRHDLEAMAGAVTPATRLLLIANPNNPTGTHVGRNELGRLLRGVPERVIVVVDEAYLEYAEAEDYPDSLTLRSLRERLVVLRTFSKIHGLAALRVGYGVGPAHLVEYMNRVRAPFNVNGPAQAAAVAALADEEHIQRSRRMNSEQRARLTRALERLDLMVAPSQANFLYVDLGRPAAPVHDRLLDRGVIVRAFGSLPTCLRITVGTPDENDRLLQTLAEVLR